jgi:hypothetical protein
MRLIALSFIALLAYAQITQFPAAGGSSGNATTINGASVPASQACLGSNSSSQLIAGSCAKTWIKATQSTGQVIPDSTDTDLSFDTNNANNTGSAITHSNTVNPERFIAAVAGNYTGSCQFKSADTTSSGFFEVRIFHNVGGVDTEVAIAPNVITSIAFTTNQVSFSEHMAVGDYLHCSTTHNGGFTMTTEPPTSFWIQN